MWRDSIILYVFTWSSNWLWSFDFLSHDNEFELEYLDDITKCWYKEYGSCVHELDKYMYFLNLHKPFYIVTLDIL